MTQLLPNFMQNNAYSARLDRQVLRRTWTEGVIEGMQVSQRAAGGTAMFVDIAVGAAVVYGDDQTDQGAYLTTMTALETVAIAAAPGSNSRIDLVYWGVNDPNAGSVRTPANVSSVGVVTGVASATPAVPALPASAIPLATVLVATGTLAITDAMITSARYPAWTNGSVPPGTVVEFSGPAANVPADYLLAFGQSVNKLTEWRIRAMTGDVYGSTSTNFSIIDKRGRIGIGLDDMGGADAGRLSVAAGTTLGASGGIELQTLITANLASHSHTDVHTHTIDPPVTGVNISDPGHVHPPYPGQNGFVYDDPGAGIAGLSGPNVGNNMANITGAATTGISATVDIVPFTSGGSSSGGTGNTGSGTPFSILNPYVLVNYIVKR